MNTSSVTSTRYDKLSPAFPHLPAHACFCLPQISEQLFPSGTTARILRKNLMSAVKT